MTQRKVTNLEKMKRYLEDAKRHKDIQQISHWEKRIREATSK